MGIRGLTTFIQNRSHLYLEEYDLHDTSIVIDGNAIACQLYKWHCKSNDCFGGDYDKYAALIENFFQMLSSCNIIPYVVFDGGYESRKVATVISRMKNKIKSAQQLNSDVVLKLNIKCVRCDFESDTEIANIARRLNCPVLSYDSDFFIFDVLYIPFSTFELCARRKKRTQTNEPYTYIFCKVYRIEKFLESFGGLDKNSLPILAVLLGNDYVKRSVFSMFYRNLKIQKCHGKQNDQQKRIKSVIIWLQNESTDSAIQKVLSRYKCKRRKLIANKINTAIKGYNCTDSAYLSYLDITPIQCKEALQAPLDINYIDDENIQDENIDNSEIDSDSEEDTSSTNEDHGDFNFDDGELNSDVPTIFIEKYRRCLYPPSFMDILKQNKYYCIPQVEDDAQEYSHAVSSEILSAIHKVLKNSKDNLTCVARNTNGRVKSVLLPSCDVNMPTLMEIQNINLPSRKYILLKVLKIDANITKNCLSFFPESWHLFIITVKYLIDKSVITCPIVYALIMCKIFLCYIDKHVGLCRSKKALEKKLNMTSISSDSNNKTNHSIKLCTIDTLENINYNDSLVCLKNLFPYFHLDVKLKTNYRLYDRNVLHSMAQFQSCLLHVKYLNNLLNLPFSNFIMSDIFNGTFVYNLSVNFMKRSNLDSYVKLLLKDSPTVFNGFSSVVENLKEHLTNVQSDAPPKRRRKKKKPKVNEIDYKQDSSEGETAVDPNNKYSVLISSEKDC
ncbi:protein asteroid [Anoplophora glabripennis]|nr:protein asteroid [Anoplophora glabripennis]